MKNDIEQPTPTKRTKCASLFMLSTDYDTQSYINLLSKNKNYQLYILATFCQHLGHWFVRIASILTVERLSGGSATALGSMVMAHTIPHIFWTPLGGILADSFDRKRLLIILDLINAFVVMGYLVAIRSENMAMLYAVTVLRSSVHSFYEPVTRSVVPMLVEEEEDLKRIVTINGTLWSSMLAVGGLIMGPISALVGLEACYAIDSLTYFISAFVTSGLKGNFSVSQKVESKITTLTKEQSKKSFLNVIKIIFNPFRSLYVMSKEVLQYLYNSGFGMLTLLQPCASAIWGSSDVLNASYAHVLNDEAETSRRLGLISSSVGLGCLLGPMLLNLIVDVDQPRRLQLACVNAFAWMGFAWLGMSYVSEYNFKMICVFTFIRNIGSGILWIDSTLLLQKLSAAEKLGRILAFEHSASLACEALTAYIVGRLQDGGQTISEGSRMSGVLGIIAFFLWSIFHYCGGGAANPRFNEEYVENNKNPSAGNAETGGKFENSTLV